MRRPVRFLLVGAGGYGVNVAAFGLLYRAGAPYAEAAVLAYLLANALMYLGNRYLTFRLGHAGFWAAYARYVLVGVAVAALTAGLLAALVEGGGLGAHAGQALALLLVTPIAFVLFKRWTFRVTA
jgi:putative flippase GtrA